MKHSDNEYFEILKVEDLFPRRRVRTGNEWEDFLIAVADIHRKEEIRSKNKNSGRDNE